MRENCVLPGSFLALLCVRVPRHPYCRPYPARHGYPAGRPIVDHTVSPVLQYLYFNRFFFRAKIALWIFYWIFGSFWIQQFPGPRFPNFQKSGMGPAWARLGSRGPLGWAEGRPGAPWVAVGWAPLKSRDPSKGPVISFSYSRICTRKSYSQLAGLYKRYISQ